MISVDSIYQTVLVLANKEQRGYITPQEFNLFADKAQKEIVDQYFYDINQFGRLHGNDTEYADMLDLLSEKISVLEVRDMGVTVPATGILTYQNLRFPVYRLGSIMMPNGTKIQEVNNNEFYNLRSSPLMRPSLTSPSGPVFVNRFDGLNIDPPNVGTVDVSYIKLYKPQWGYVVVNEKALFDPDPAKTTNFDLHPVEESELVNRILMLAGITLEKPGLTQVAASLEAAKLQQEKQ